ncbi:MAG: nucleoside deaminase [Solirubrobacterales bacterium]|nr:nucleoside deaminase [Solirubrobacterales bacterium]
MTAPHPEDERWLRRAIELSEDARAAGDQPFGSLLVGPDGELLAEALNTVVTDDDVSAHPELKIAVWAGQNLDRERAAGSTMYTSCENCAMCSAAMVWSGLGALVFALSGASLMEMQGGRHDSLALSSSEVFDRASHRIEVRGPALESLAAEAHRGYW